MGRQHGTNSDTRIARRGTRASASASASRGWSEYTHALPHLSSTCACGHRVSGCVRLCVGCCSVRVATHLQRRRRAALAMTSGRRRSKQRDQQEEWPQELQYRSSGRATLRLPPSPTGACCRWGCGHRRPSRRCRGARVRVLRGVSRSCLDDPWKVTAVWPTGVAERAARGEASGVKPNEWNNEAEGRREGQAAATDICYPARRCGKRGDPAAARRPGTNSRRRSPAAEWRSGALPIQRNRQCSRAVRCTVVSGVHSALLGVSGVAVAAGRPIRFASAPPRRSLAHDEPALQSCCTALHFTSVCDGLHSAGSG